MRAFAEAQVLIAKLQAATGLPAVEALQYALSAVLAGAQPRPMVGDVIAPVAPPFAVAAAMAPLATTAPWRRVVGRHGNGSGCSQHEQIQGKDERAVMQVEHDGTVEGNCNVGLAVALVNDYQATRQAYSEKIAAVVNARDARAAYESKLYEVYSVRTPDDGESAALTSEDHATARALRAALAALEPR
jgi:hypothetical protein